MADEVVIHFVGGQGVEAEVGKPQVPSERHNEDEQHSGESTMTHQCIDHLVHSFNDPISTLSWGLKKDHHFSDQANGHSLDSQYQQE
jgi:hypothetical protein